MSGNVWEWCFDWLADDYYKQSPALNPLNLKKADYRVLRGGSWVNADRNLRCAGRDRDQPDGRNDDVGFRCSRAYL